MSRIASVVTPPRARVRTIEDLAPRHRETKGTKLSGSRWARATPVVVRRIEPDTVETPPETIAKNVYDHDGLGPYSELRGRMFA